MRKAVGWYHQNYIKHQPATMCVFLSLRENPVIPIKFMEEFFHWVVSIYSDRKTHIVTADALNYKCKSHSTE